MVVEEEKELFYQHAERHNITKNIYTPHETSASQRLRTPELHGFILSCIHPV
jgi:hypothetical protein